MCIRDSNNRSLCDMSVCLSVCVFVCVCLSFSVLVSVSTSLPKTLCFCISLLVSVTVASISQNVVECSDKMFQNFFTGHATVTQPCSDMYVDPVQSFYSKPIMCTGIKCCGARAWLQWENPLWGIPVCEKHWHAVCTHRVFPQLKQRTRCHT